VLVEHSFAQTSRDEIDELIAAQNAGEIGVIKDVFGAGQTQSCARDDDWLVRRTMVWFTLNFPSTLKDLGHEVAEFSEMIAIRSRCLWSVGCGSLRDERVRFGR
jgi:hypothetical protein